MFIFQQNILLMLCTKQNPCDFLMVNINKYIFKNSIFIYFLSIKLNVVLDPLAFIMDKNGKEWYL